MKKASNRHIMALQYGLPAICRNTLLVKSALTCNKMNFVDLEEFFSASSSGTMQR